MERLSRLVCEILSSTYIKKINDLISQIDWDNVDKDFLDIYKSSRMLINNIENIGNYEGENASGYLKELKSQAGNLVYVLKHAVEYYNKKQQ